MAELKFVPFSSSPDVSFWHALTQQKLEHFKLSEEPQPVSAYYLAGDRSGFPARILAGDFSFNGEAVSPTPGAQMVQGVIVNRNTLDAFKQQDINQISDNVANQILHAITSGRAIHTPSLLVSFGLLTFADLKKYQFFSWFCFPTIKEPVTSNYSGLQPLSELLSSSQINALVSSSSSLSPFFSLSDSNIQSLDRIVDIAKEQKIVVGFVDPSSDDKYPGWPLRAFLVLLQHHIATHTARDVVVVCLRGQGDEIATSSRAFSITISALPQTLPEGNFIKGWEKNSNDKLAPKFNDLSSTMDPVRLAENAIDLNLKLMRWRLMPSLNLSKVSATKCLIIGAGTLGCNVARALLGWGVRHITFVDNAKVSFSNPVRQSLYTFDDCVNGGKKKAQAAATHIKEIFPGITSDYVDMTIPMPGHPVFAATKAESLAAVERLHHLIDNHDAVFLLMDTRESRWLPTLICAALEKIAITSAIGFDSFVALRHGLTTSTGARSVGCYFCSDITAPRDSIKDRTLDQQCTVSRPGISMIACGMAVELLVATLQHPDGGLAPADDDAGGLSTMGAVPHQVRGQLGLFSTDKASASAFEHCTACSPSIVEFYRDPARRTDMLMNAFARAESLEEITGLHKLHAEAMRKLEDIDWLDDEFGDDADATTTTGSE